jgi:hypothetical protein
MIHPVPGWLPIPSSIISGEILRDPRRGECRPRRMGCRRIRGNGRSALALPGDGHGPSRHWQWGFGCHWQSDSLRVGSDGPPTEGASNRIGPRSESASAVQHSGSEAATVGAGTPPHGARPAAARRGKTASAEGHRRPPGCGWQNSALSLSKPDSEAGKLSDGGRCGGLETQGAGPRVRVGNPRLSDGAGQWPGARCHGARSARRRSPGRRQCH